MPPMIVAPERDVPGISASACAKPIFSASVQRIASTLSMRTVDGATRCRRSTQRMTNAPTMNASATGTGANRWRLDDLREQQAEHRGGQEGEQQVDDEALRVARLGEARGDLAEPRAIFPADGEDGARLDDDLEHLRALARVAEQRSGDDQVAGRRDRQEFGQALDDAEDECDENGWMIQRRGRANACERASIVAWQLRGIVRRVSVSVEAP